MKRQLREWLASGRWDAVTGEVVRQKRLLSALTTLTYDADPLVAWRAIDAAGRASARIAEYNPEFVRGHLRRLFWLITDESGAIAWRAPELIGELIRGRPREFADFIPLLLSLLGMEPEDLVRFKAGSLWAIGRVSEVAPDSIGSALPDLRASLADPDPQNRGMALWCLSRVGCPIDPNDLHRLLADNGPVVLYGGGELLHTSVGNLARRSLQPGVHVR